MDKQKKQIIVLVVCGVLTLGAGSYFVFGRAGGGAGGRSIEPVAVVRKERVHRPDGNSTGARKDADTKKRDKSSAPTTSGRKERGGNEMVSPERRRKAGHPEVKVKKDKERAKG